MQRERQEVVSTCSYIDHFYIVVKAHNKYNQAPFPEIVWFGGKFL